MHKTEHSKKETRLIFALDIGTRSVIGIVGKRESNLLKILACEAQEYDSRAVIDGQIEDIAETARTAQIVRKRLEKKLSITLSDVCIAAAGRVLKTQTASFELAVPSGKAIDESFLVHLESGAVQDAYHTLFSQTEKNSPIYFCVGHAVSRYFLDGYELSTLEGHRGKTARAEVIATFLPQEVVDSLYAVTGKMGLTVSGLTLEPIAAMNAVIPTDIRKLNLALVDIGAGTSDIALCEDGHVTGYTMITSAGDEITENIMKRYLVDFRTAEQMKRMALAPIPVIGYRNILGQFLQEPIEDFQKAVQKSISSLAGQIGKKILEVNGKAPAAVFLVGGGSRVPNLCSLVAKELNIADTRVANGGNNYMKEMIISSLPIYGPEFATPVGIALTSAFGLSTDTFAVTVNGEKLHMFNSWDMTILNVLMMSGFRYVQIMGHVGKSLSYTLNGKKSSVRGGMPIPAQITQNGKPSSLTACVHPGDQLTFRETVHGKDANAHLSDIIPHFAPITVYFNDTPLNAGSIVTLNGNLVSEDVIIPNGANIKYKNILTVEELKEEYPNVISLPVLKNGMSCTLTDSLADKDRLTPVAEEADFGFPAFDDLPAAEAEESFYTEPSFSMPSPQPSSGFKKEKPESSASSGSPIQIHLNGDLLELSAKPDGSPHLFVDLLNYVNIDPHNPKGIIFLKLNGRDASYLDILQNGDRIDIYWEESH